MNPDSPCLPLSKVQDYINSEIYICDTVKGYKRVNNSLAYLYLGNKYPYQLVTIIIKGKQVNKELHLLRTGFVHFRGKVFLYKKKPAIIVNNSILAGTGIMI